jgi:hypothetical protein
MKQATERRLYHSATPISDAWEEILLPWFRAHAQNLSAGPLTLVVIPRRSLAYHLKARLLAAGVPIINLHFVTPSELRVFLSRGTAAPLPSRADLHLLLSLAAEEKEGPVARAITQAPDHLLRAIDQIEATGADFAELCSQDLREIAAEFHRLVTTCGFQTVSQIDRAISASPDGGPFFRALLVAGFDALHWPDWPLLRATVRASAHATILLADPRDEARELDECWVGTWEQEFGAAEPIGGDTSDKIPPRHFLVGNNTSEQADAIVAMTRKYLADPTCERLGIFLAGAGGLARSVAARLEKCGIPHHDGFAQLAPGPFEDPAWLAWIELQENPRLGVLLNFLRVCETSTALFDQLAIDKVDNILSRALSDILIDDLEVLQKFLASDSRAASIAVANGLGAFTFLPKAATIDTFLDAVEKVCGQFDWQDNWAEIEILTESWRHTLTSAFSREIFLRWLTESCSSFFKVREPHGDHPYSRIQLLGAAEAEGQDWSHAIFAGLNEGDWPRRDEESLFVSEEDLAELNRKIKTLNARAIVPGGQGEGHWTVSEGRTLCLGPLESRALARRQFKNLVDSVRVEMAVTAAVFEESEPSRLRNPSEFFTQLYFETHGKAVSQTTMFSLRDTTRAWVARSDLLGGEKLDAPDVKQTRVAYDERRASGKSGEYEFALLAPPERPVDLSAGDWQNAITATALIWMKTFLGVEPGGANGGEWKLATGNWVHGWLAKISGDPFSNRFVPIPAAEKIPDLVGNAACEFRLRIEALLKSIGRPLPDWWASGWSYARYLADSFAASLSAVTGWEQCATEWKLEPTQIISFPGIGELRMHGRIDLIFAREEAKPSRLGWTNAWVIDFKTKPSAEPASAAKLKEGKGIQIALYALALHALGVNVGASIVSPTADLSDPQLAISDLEEQTDFWRELIQMQNSGVFGMHGAVRNTYGFSPQYPIATLAVDPDLLAEKWERTHPGFVRNKGETGK